MRTGPDVHSRETFAFASVPKCKGVASLALRLVKKNREKIQ